MLICSYWMWILFLILPASTNKSINLIVFKKNYSSIQKKVFPLPLGLTFLVFQRPVCCLNNGFLHRPWGPALPLWGKPLCPGQCSLVPVLGVGQPRLPVLTALPPHAPQRAQGWGAVGLRRGTWNPDDPLGWESSPPRISNSLHDLK